MLHISRISFGWLAMLCAVFAAADEPGLRLICETEKGEAPLAAVIAGDKLQLMIDQKAVDVPSKATWRLEGDMLTSAELFNWSPSYGIRRLEESMLIKPTHIYGAVVSGHFAPSSGMQEWAGEGLKQFWPALAASNEAVVVVWIVQGKIAHVRVCPLRVDRGAIDASFELTREEAKGQPALLFWANGRFIAPTRMFADPVTPRVHMAVQLDDWPLVEPLVQANPQLGMQLSTKGSSLLHLAAEAGAVAVLKGLIAADPKARPVISSEKTGVLDWPSSSGRLEVVELLLAKGFDKNYRDKDEKSALIRAASRGHTGIVEILLKAGADVNFESSDHRMAITEAIDAGYTDIVELLYPKGEFMVRDGADSRKVLRTQARKGQADMVRWMLAKGVSPNSDDEGLSALAHAAFNGHREVLESLLKAKASMRWRDEKSGSSPLLYALTRDQAECAKLLLAAGADPMERNKNKLNALHVAAAFNAAKCMELFVAKGSARSVRNGAGKTALEVALLSQSRDVVQILTTAGDRIDVKASNAETLMESALRVDCASLITRAIEDGWPVDRKFSNGWPLFVAAKQLGAATCLKVLREAGAQIDAAGPVPIVGPRELDAPPKALKVFIPPDPREADDQFESQTVLVECLVDGNGKVLFPRIVKTPDERLSYVVLDALAHWEFSPGTRGGDPVAAKLRFPVVLPSSSERAFSLSAVDEIPKPLKQTPPEYPFASRVNNEQARVLVRFVVTTAGEVREIQVLEKTSEECAAAARKALSKWKYVPGKIAGKPVPVVMLLPIIFSLND